MMVADESRVSSMNLPKGGDCTIGVDVGTTSVKAVAVDARGKVIARARVPHPVSTPTADNLEHDAGRAWRRDPRRGFAVVSAALDGPAAGVVVTSMVPSITAVNRRGVPQLPGLLYGDSRARHPGPEVARAEGLHGNGGERDEGARMLSWAVSQRPGAAGYWPCQAVATHALCGVPAVDSATASTFGELHSGGRWDGAALAALGVEERQVSVVTPLGSPAGMVAGTPTKVGGGSIDAFCEQMVAGADQPGDVLAIFGATLVIWVVTDAWIEVPGLTTFPGTVPGQVMIGGPSNAGALFADWARSLAGGPGRSRRAPSDPDGVEARVGDPHSVPVWLPYLRGERAPFHDPRLRASLHRLDITQGPTSLVRASYEASGFVIRRIVERSGVDAHRIVASGGGSRSVPWMQAVADATGLPVDPVAVPEGAALGAAFLARMAAGLEPDFGASACWAAHGRRIDPDAAWAAAASERFEEFEALGPEG
jgi:xylulokinase